ncbi:MAG TPA: ABC transporter ATP-binding protein [Gemmatimonadaceae bacterium]|nr:ABC transporter ATP-binding protein [Gemmatimonadaceae bacterium]
MTDPRAPLPDLERPRGMRARLEALRYLPQLVRLVWQTHRGLTTTMIVLRLVRAFVPVATLWAAKLIIDEVVLLTREPGTPLTALWRVVALELAIVVAGELLARASALVESLLGDLFSNHISVRLMRHAATLDLQQFEDPDFYDHLERARRQTTARIGLIAMLLTMGQDIITLGTLGAALVVHNPWLLLLLTLAILPSFLGETHFASLSYSLLFRRTPERRELDYLRYVGASDKTAKEVQMFGLAGWLADRYASLAQRYFEENRALSIRKGVISALLSLVGTLGYYGAYVTILLRAVAGAISLGTLTFLASAFARSRDLIQRLLLSASDIYEQSLYLKDLFVFFEMRPTISSKPGAQPVPTPIRRGFVFEDVGFRYPGSERWAIRHVSLTISPGERIALVGENGAGKTTITKLLARLYDPTEGRILLDGIDLREYDLASLREAIGVIFQDFVRYDMRFDENVGVGEIEGVTDYLAAVRDAPGNGATPPPALVDAAERSLASSLLPRFERGYRQMLGRRFDDGVDLSGGEWQKIALARAYMREAQLLILDEPTAALDARAEYEVFVRFNQLMAGRMAVVISHRFSTVRMADRIVVLGDGRVLEEGTHEALLAREGLYAELFEMQAAGYR